MVGYNIDSLVNDENSQNYVGLSIEIYAISLVSFAISYQGDAISNVSFGISLLDFVISLLSFCICHLGYAISNVSFGISLLNFSKGHIIFPTWVIFGVAILFVIDCCRMNNTPIHKKAAGHSRQHNRFLPMEKTFA